MKTFALCGMAGALAFFATSYQLGLFDESSTPEQGVEQETPVKEEKQQKPKGKFPQDLARAVRQQPMPLAAGFNAENTTHKLVVLKSSGALHPWHEHIDEDWQAQNVEETELALVVLPQRKTRVSIHTYPNGAPPIERFQWDAEAYVVDARTGEVLATRRFQNAPRAIRPIEAYELTAIGEPVARRTVFNWVMSAARREFPQDVSDAPLITVID